MINIAVLFGGKSVEHEVSVITAMQALSVIDKMDGYRAIPVYVDKEGSWHTGDGLNEVENYRDIPALIKRARTVALVPSAQRGAARLVNVDPHSKALRSEDSRIDIVFPIIHGTGGEDGTLQGMLDLIGVPYIGCGALSAAVTMDKTATKALLKNARIPQMPGKWFYSEVAEEQTEIVVEACEADLLYPMIIKPADIGSSVGVRTANNADELREGVRFAAKFSSRVIVEYKLEDNFEINISILGDRISQKLSVCEHPMTEREILTYEDKYMSSDAAKGMSAAKRQIPAEIPDELRREVESIAQKCFIMLDCAGVVRIDFLVDISTLKPYVCELNTIPGSLAFYLWEATGVSFEALIRELIDIAYRCHRRKNSVTRSIDSNLLSQGDLLGIKK